jgi:hypothetical protein
LGWSKQEICVFCIDAAAPYYIFSHENHSTKPEARQEIFAGGGDVSPKTVRFSGALPCFSLQSA